ncbi:MAG TPA: M36 family metallopeptidase [Conexibacter sp.]|nr:M36 family metallopeptidase [Conexibacter sp.]
MSGRGVLTVAAAAIVALATSAAPAGAIRAAQPAGARPQFDVRSGQRTPVPAAVSGARHAFLARLGIEAHLSSDPVGGGVRVLDRTNGFLSGLRAGDAATVALAWVRAHADVFGLTAAQIDALRLTRRTTSNDGVTHLTWVPVSNGVPAYDSELRVHVTRDGRVAAASGPPLGGLAISSATPRISASRALGIARDDVGGPAGLPRALTRPGVQQRTTFSNGDSARLVVFDAPGGDRLAWRIEVAGHDPYMYDEVVDASSGEVLSRRNLTDFAASNASVFFYHPGSAADDAILPANHVVDISRWLTPSATTLTGPNAHAYADPNDDGSTDGTPIDVGPSAGSDWLYPQQAVLPASGQICSSFTLRCTWDGGTNLSTEPTNRAQVTTQVFFYVNNYHDWLEQPDVGFTAADGNFQGDDPVNAETDDGGGVDNANMSTLPDGLSPRMQMYLFKGFTGLPWPAVNGGDDASVVYHEYTHGLSNRLIDDANGLNENQGRAMGEGWSDWYAMDYLVANGEVADTSADGEVVVGEYVTDNRVSGIRNQPLDCSVGSSAPACSGTATSHGSGGFTYADLGRVGSYDASTPRFEVHDDGEIWSETLWDLRKALGASAARRLVTNAMRLSPADPTFLDERDAILLADQIEGGANHDAIWQVFAARGMGYGARTSSPNATRGIASFATPHLAENGGTTLDDAAPLGDGDGVAEPGEVLRLGIALDNPGLNGLTNVHGTLSSSTPGVSVVVPDAGYGSIASGAEASNATPFALTLASSVACGSHVPLTLHVTSDQGALDVPVLLSLGSGDGVFTSSDTFPKTILDGNATSTNAVSTLSVPTSGRIDHLRVTVNVTHNYVGDLRARLTAPSGQTIDLLERPGLSNDGFGSADHWAGPITFDDAASQAIQDIPRGSSFTTLSGSYAPDEPLAALAGQNRLGTWTLRMTDEATPDQGTLNGWSIDTDQPACSTSSTLPTATTGAATGVTATGATLGGSVDPGGEATTYRFDYGTTSAYGASTAEASAGGGNGAVAQSAGVGGLAASTTYHFRIVALRGGIAVGFGADQTFLTPSPRPIVRPTVVPKPTHVTTKATLNARNAFAFAFRDTPLLRGSIRFTIPKLGRTKAIAFGAKSFTVPSSGRVKLTVKVGGKALAQLRKRHTVKVKVTIVLDGKAFSFTLKLSAPKPKPRRR